MTFDTLSHAAYDVATAMGSVTTPKGGYRKMPLDILSSRKSGSVAPHLKYASAPRPKLSASTQIHGSAKALAREAVKDESASWSEVARKEVLASTIADAHLVGPHLSLRNHRASVYNQDKRATASTE